jgi:hypothetical protein
LNVFEIIDTFAFYGFDVIALAIATSAIVQIIKHIFKNCKKKIFTFLPFIVGGVIYAIYAALSHLSAAYIVNNITDILEHGLCVGSLSTVLYVWYEQFIREKDEVSTTEGVIATLIEGYVPTNAVETTAKQIAAAIEKDVTGSGATKALDILSSNAEDGVTERDLTLLSKLIIETLAHLTTTT